MSIFDLRLNTMKYKALTRFLVFDRIITYVKLIQRKGAGEWHRGGRSKLFMTIPEYHVSNAPHTKF